MALAAFSSPLPEARESSKRAAAGGASNYTPGSARGFQRHAQRLGERLAPPGADRGCLMGTLSTVPPRSSYRGGRGGERPQALEPTPGGVAALAAAPRGSVSNHAPAQRGGVQPPPPLSPGYASLTGTMKSKMSLGFCSSRYSAARVSMTSSMRPLSPATEAS